MNLPTGDGSIGPLVQPGAPLNPDEVTRYSRHLLLPGIGMDGQRRLRAARVAVVGAGGLGSPALLYLAAAGVGSLTIIDDDLVELSNLQRQVLHEEPGASKAASAMARLRALNPDVAVSGVSTRLSEGNASALLAGHDLIIDGTDNFATRYAISDACTELGLPVIWASVLRHQAQLTTFWATPPQGEGVTLRDLFPSAPPEGSVPACGDAGVLGPLVGQVGSMMAAEAIRLITGMGRSLLGRVLVMDLADSSMREIPLRPRAAGASGSAGARDAASAGASWAGEGGSGSAAGADAAGDSPAPAAESVPLLTATQLAEQLADGAPLTLIDVREPAEVALGAIPGATPLPLAQALSTREWPAPDDAVVVYCKQGPRAHLAAAHLRALGARSVSVLAGGMLAWIDEIDPTLPRY